MNTNLPFKAVSFMTALIVAFTTSGVISSSSANALRKALRTVGAVSSFNTARNSSS